MNDADSSLDLAHRVSSSGPVFLKAEVRHVTRRIQRTADLVVLPIETLGYITRRVSEVGTRCLANASGFDFSPGYLIYSNRCHHPKFCILRTKIGVMSTMVPTRLSMPPTKAELSTKCHVRIPTNEIPRAINI